MTVLELRDVFKSYGQGAARGCPPRGGPHSRGRVMVAVMGPSGSGKSTLLTIAGSLEAPATGKY